VVGAVAYTTVRQWVDVRDTFTALAWPAVLLSLVFVLLALGAQTMAWRASLGAVGHPIGVRISAQIYLIGLLARYIPGSLWAFVLQMELGRRARLPRARVFLASLVVTGLGLTAAVLLGATNLPVLFEHGTVIAVALAVLVPLAVVCAHPRVLTLLTRRMLTVLRRPPLDAPITWAGVGSVIGWNVLGWAFLGAHLWLLAGADSTGGAGLRELAGCVGAMALGVTAGTVAFLSPSGLGVREATITAALLPYVPAGTALGMALVSRLVLTIGEVLAAGVAAASAPRVRRGASEEVADAPV
jgi:glycosyltransferase 2 family protein